MSHDQHGPGHTAHDGGNEPVPVTPEALDQRTRIDLHNRSLDRAVWMTQMADGKAAPVLALHVSLAAVTVTQTGGVGEVLGGGSAGLAATTAAWPAFVLYAVCSLLAVVQAMLVYLPGGRRKRPPGKAPSVVYFDDIQWAPRDRFIERAMGLSFDLTEVDVLEQVHAVSTLASAKFAGVRRAFFSSAIALGAWLVLIAVVHI